MSAMVLQFRPRPRSPAVYENELDRARELLNQWAMSAATYGWFLVAPPGAPTGVPTGAVTPRARSKRAARERTPNNDITSVTIGHRAVDADGIFELTLEFDGWALLTRRGELSVFDTLTDALASICPATIAA